jgi:hypothetical protein
MSTAVMLLIQNLSRLSREQNASKSKSKKKLSDLQQKYVE